uniref:NADH dehydrogenase subunit 4L n=1 Tax=Thrips setosus TaxID=163897 RepID=A0A8K1RPD4_9NEOP|nr:NADH dehydrogenase subunit 4L [Thrips setosus]
MISFFLFFLICLIVFFKNYSSFLNSLLILESISLVVFFFLFCFMISGFSLKVLLYYFVFIVCESSLGLSILVKSIKFFGSMSFRSMNLLMF